MYQAETILELKEPKFIDDDGKRLPLSDYKGKKDAAKLFPYNRVKVIGQSPVMHAHSASGWEGPDAQGVIIQPITDFAANLDEPYGRLQRLYAVAEIPEDDIAKNVVASDRGFHQVPASKLLGPTPEEQFRAASGADPAPTRPSGNTFEGSPLGELDPEPSTSPLD